MELFIHSLSGAFFIVLSANLQTPLVPSKESSLSTLVNASSNMLNFSLPHSTIVWKVIFESLLRLQCYKKGGKRWSRTFQSLHCSQNFLFIQISHSQLPPIILVSDVFPAITSQDRSWGSFILNIFEFVYQQETPITTLSSKGHVHKLGMCFPQKGCLEGQKWPRRRQFLIFTRWAGSWGNGHPQNHCRGFLLAWLHPEFHHPHVFASSISLTLSWASSCCRGRGAPAVLSCTSPCSGAGELILLTHIWKHSFFCCAKSTQRHRIGTIKHAASWGSISSAWRVLHHTKLWLLQPHTSNLLHFSGPVSVVWYRSAQLFILI